MGHYFLDTQYYGFQKLNGLFSSVKRVAETWRTCTNDGLTTWREEYRSLDIYWWLCLCSIWDISILIFVQTRLSFSVALNNFPFLLQLPCFSQFIEILIFIIFNTFSDESLLYALGFDTRDKIHTLYSQDYMERKQMRMEKARTNAENSAKKQKISWPHQSVIIFAFVCFSFFIQKVPPEVCYVYL